MLPWYQWLVLGLVPPLIFLLYFLKLRRIPVEVPSTYLWTKTVEDMHVNSIWQNLRRNLLLLFQLLAVLLLIIACLSPGCEGEKLIGERFIFVVDQSASMSATDTETGISRLEEAKNQICTLIDRMKPSDAAMVISFSSTESVDQSYTVNKSLLKRKVRAIEQTQRGSDIERALLAASGLANPGRTSDRNSQTDVQVADSLDAKLFIFSDGAVKTVPKFFMGSLEPEYRPMGSFEPSNNIGITAFSINDQLEAGGQTMVFARLQNSGEEDKQVKISLYVGDDLVDVRSVNVPGSEDALDVTQGPGRLNGAPLNFDLSPFMAGLEEATPIRLKIDDKDTYMQDNEAFCVLNPPRIANVLIVSDYNNYLRFATSTEPIKKFAVIEFERRDFLDSKEYKEKSTLGVYDLIIFDQCAPETMPVCNTVFWGALPPDEQWKSVMELESTPIVDINSGHPLMFDVQMGNVLILKSMVLEGPQGSLPLVESTKGTVMMIGPRAGFEDLVIGFPLIEYTDENETSINTNWTKNNLSFPFFVHNVLMNLSGRSRFNATRTNPPGELVKIKPQFPFPAIEIKTPGGSKSTVKARGDSSFVFSQTDQSGIYEVSEPGAENLDQMFAVNLLDRLESDIAVRDELNLGYEEVKATLTVAPARKNFWTWITLLALVVISIEWYIYNRRVFI